MAEIQEYHHKTSSRQKGKNPPFPALWQRFRSLDEFTQIAIVALLLIVIVVPLIFGVKNIQTLKNHAASQVGAYDDEFVGPFASWINVKTVYGAKGDGVTDDTQALQQAFNDVGTAGHGTILWIPAGTYKITSTLTIAHRTNISVIGEDPSTTKLVWTGPSGTDMTSFNGVAYSRFDRITWDGAGAAKAAVNQSYSGTGGYFDTNNEYADDTFENVQIGILGGDLGYGFAETTVIRDHFTNNSIAGIFTANFNALDLWVWYSTFTNCDYGITNRYVVNGTANGGAGDWKVYNSNFLNSKSADLAIGNTVGIFSARNNFSSGSAQFFYSYGLGTPEHVTLQNNTILDTTNPHSIEYGPYGPLIAIDNKIRSLSTATGPAIDLYNTTAPQTGFTIGNTFTVTNPTSSGGELKSINDEVVPLSSLSSMTIPSLPGTLTNYHRQVFDVPVGASASTIQSTINQAAQYNGNKVVVHFPAGQYNITQTITVPANNDMQLVGDGGNTNFVWSGSGNGPVFYLSGPTRITLRDFQVMGNNNVTPYADDGIIVDNADQQGGRVFAQEAYVDGSSNANIIVNGLDYTSVELHDFIHADSNGSSLQVIGGPSAAAGTWLGGKVDIFAGDTSNNTITYAVSNGAHMLANDTWYETWNSSLTGYANISGPSTVTLAGSRISTGQTNQPIPAIAMNSSSGSTTILNTFADDRIVTSGSGTNGNFLGIGFQSTLSNLFTNSSTPPLNAYLLENYQSVGTQGDATQLSDIGTYDPTYITNLLAQERNEQPQLITSLPSGVTDLRMFRVFIEYTRNGMQLNASSVPSVTLAPTNTSVPTSIVLSPTPTIGISDTQAPSVTSFTLSNSQTKALVTNGVVSRKTSYTLTAVAQDNVGVAKVLFSVNNSTVCTDITAPYTCTWKVPSGKSNTSYTLKATAYDLAGNISSPSTMTVTSQ